VGLILCKYYAKEILPATTAPVPLNKPTKVAHSSEPEVQPDPTPEPEPEPEPILPQLESQPEPVMQVDNEPPVTKTSSPVPPKKTVTVSSFIKSVNLKRRADSPVPKPVHDEPPTVTTAQADFSKKEPPMAVDPTPPPPVLPSLSQRRQFYINSLTNSSMSVFD
jgi:hypothetical protein